MFIDVWSTVICVDLYINLLKMQ